MMSTMKKEHIPVKYSLFLLSLLACSHAVCTPALAQPALPDESITESQIVVNEINPADIQHNNTLVMPSQTELVGLIRNTLNMVDTGNKTANYTDLYEILTDEVKKNIDVNKLSDALYNFREQKVDMSPIVRTTPKFFKKPEIDQEGVLKVMGVFPTKPQNIRFDLNYKKLDGQWRLEAISIDSARVADEAPPPTTTKW